MKIMALAVTPALTSAPRLTHIHTHKKCSGVVTKVDSFLFLWSVASVHPTLRPSFAFGMPPSDVLRLIDQNSAVLTGHGTQRAVVEGKRCWAKTAMHDRLLHIHNSYTYCLHARLTATGDELAEVKKTGGGRQTCKNQSVRHMEPDNLRIHDVYPYNMLWYTQRKHDVTRRSADSCRRMNLQKSNRQVAANKPASIKRAET
jgi:hypothetical protein